MFKRLFGGRASEAPETEASGGAGGIEGAYHMVQARAASLKKEYERTREDPEITKSLDAFMDPDFIAKSRDAIFLSAENARDSGAHEILALAATVFMAMANEVFPSDRDFESFSHWATVRSRARQRDLVRFAYITTAREQKQSGEKHPVSLACWTVLVTLAANANDDPTSKAVAHQLLAYIDRARARELST